MQFSEESFIWIRYPCALHRSALSLQKAHYTIEAAAAFWVLKRLNRLLVVPKESPQLSWTSHRYQTSQNAAAIPIFKPLIAKSCIYTIIITWYRVNSENSVCSVCFLMIFLQIWVQTIESNLGEVHPFCLNYALADNCDRGKK